MESKSVLFPVFPIQNHPVSNPGRPHGCHSLIGGYRVTCRRMIRRMAGSSARFQITLQLALGD